MPMPLTEQDKQEAFNFIAEVLTRLSVGDPHAVCAGGAPRDLTLGQAPKDYDFFVGVCDHYDAPALRRSLSSLFGIEPMTIIELGEGAYAQGSEDVRYVLQFPYRGRLVEIIALRNIRPSSHVYGFPCKLSQCYVSLDSLVSQGPVVNSELVKEDVRRGYTMVSEDIAEQYLDRMMQKFPTVSFMPPRVYHERRAREEMVRAEEIMAAGRALGRADVPIENRMVYGA